MGECVREARHNDRQDEREVRQRISVEKVANPAGIRPGFVPNFQPLRDEKPSDSAEIHDEDPARTGGEGGKCGSESQNAADRPCPERRGRSAEEVLNMSDPLDKEALPRVMVVRLMEPLELFYRLGPGRNTRDRF